MHRIRRVVAAASKKLATMVNAQLHGVKGRAPVAQLPVIRQRRVVQEVGPLTVPEAVNNSLMVWCRRCAFECNFGTIFYSFTCAAWL